MSDLKIAIIGAGPAGCMLARLLHVEGIPSTIFEADHSLDSRFQGGTLDLGADTGLRALKRADLYPAFLKHARFDGEAYTVADKDLVKYVVMQGTKEASSRGRPEIDRSRLRELLVNSLPPDCIVWGKRLRSVGSDLTIHFEDGSKNGFDLIVGADGAFSKVRPAVSSVNPVYSGVGGHQASIENPESEHPDLYKLVNRGSLFSISDRKFLTAQQMGDGSLSLGIWILTPEERGAKVDLGQAAAVQDAIKERFGDWTPRLKEFISSASDNSLRSLPLYMLPVGHRWEHCPGVTLVGDAAHLMTPFAGEGVNLALTDAMALADAILKTKKALCAPSCSTEEVHSDVAAVLSQNVKAFEVDMFKRATAVQQHTYDNMTAIFFTPGTPRQIIRRLMLNVVLHDVPLIISPLVAVLIYMYFFILGLFYWR